MSDTECGTTPESGRTRATWMLVPRRAPWMHWWVPIPMVLLIAAAWLPSLDNETTLGAYALLARVFSLLFFAPIALIALMRSWDDAQLRVIARLRCRGREPGTPRHDYPWPPNGIRRTGAQRAKRFHRSGFVWSLGAIAVIVFLSDSHSPRWLLGFVPLALYWTLYVYLRATSGSTTVSWPVFPCRIGDTVRLRFAMSEGASMLHSVEYQLVCWRQCPHPEALASLSAAWTPIAVLPPVTEVPQPEPGGEVALAFDCPVDLPRTNLRAPYRTTWELRVSAAGAFGGYDESFLVPVY